MRLSIILFLLSFIANAQTYKATYRIEFADNLLNLKSIRKARAILMIEANKQSTFTTVNVYKQDSLNKLIAADKINPYDLMNKKYPGSQFKHFIHKNYESQDMKVQNVLVVDNYIYTQKNELNWQLYTDTLTIKNYVCKSHRQP